MRMKKRWADPSNLPLIDEQSIVVFYEYIFRLCVFNNWSPFSSLVGEQLLVPTLLLHQSAELGIGLRVVGEVWGQLDVGEKSNNTTI